MGTLMQKGVYTLEQPAPIPEWQGEGDKRKEIRIQDILRMSSGIRINAPPIPTTTRTARIPITCISTRAASTPTSTPPPGRSSGRPTPWAATATPTRCSTNYLNQLGVEKLKLDYLSYPQRATVGQDRRPRRW